MATGTGAGGLGTGGVGAYARMSGKRSEKIKNLKELRAGPGFVKRVGKVRMALLSSGRVHRVHINDRCVTVRHRSDQPAWRHRAPKVKQQNILTTH